MRKTRVLISLCLGLLIWGIFSISAVSGQVAPRLTPTLAPITTGAVPDLLISWMKFTLDPEVSCFAPGMSMGTQVFFANTGVGDAGAFTLTITVNGMDYTTLIAGLSAGESTSYWFSTTGTSMNPVQGFIDSAEEVAESDEINNQVEFQLPVPTPYISCTETPDPEITPTETATPTVTITGTPPTSTPSPVPGYQPLANGGFEDDADSDNIPDNWKGKNLVRAKQVCDKPEKFVAFRGNCAFQFKPAASGKLSQKTDIVVDQAFTSLTFSAWMQIKNVSQGLLSTKAKLVFSDDTSQVLELSNPTPDGEYGYVSNTVALEVTVTKIVVIFRPAGGMNGKIRIDDVIIALE